jgi:hypothetical protein
VQDAAQALRRRGKQEGTDWTIIAYRNFKHSHSHDLIDAAPGFGRFGGQNISRTGVHVGVLTKHRYGERVSDSNVLLRASRMGKWIPRPEPPCRRTLPERHYHDSAGCRWRGGRNRRDWIGQSSDILTYENPGDYL